MDCCGVDIAVSMFFCVRVLFLLLLLQFSCWSIVLWSMVSALPVACLLDHMNWLATPFLLSPSSLVASPCSPLSPAQSQHYFNLRVRSSASASLSLYHQQSRHGYSLRPLPLALPVSVQGPLWVSVRCSASSQEALATGTAFVGSSPQAVLCMVDL